MKAQTFTIKGSKALLTEFWNELLKLGYTAIEDRYTPTTTKDLEHICNNQAEIERILDITQYKQIYAGKYGGITDQTFNLPQQWDEALEFCKEQLDDKYWIEEIKPEIGKWYEIDYPSCHNTFIIKFSDDLSKTNNIEDNLYYSAGSFLREKTIIREVPVEEIQQYLPDGHPDKIFIPIKGKYYTQYKWDKAWRIVVCENYNLHQHYLNVNVEAYFTNHTDTSIYYCKDCITKLSTPEEKAWLDKCIEAGKFVKQNTIKKWSIGSYVVFTKSNYFGKDYILKHLHKSKIGVIAKITHHFECDDTITACDKSTYIFEKDLVKWLATKKEAEEFAKTLIPTIIELPFGNTMWTIDKDRKRVDSKYGCISFDKIIELYNWYKASPDFLGYKPEWFYFKFRCQEGTWPQFLKIYDEITK